MMFYVIGWGIVIAGVLVLIWLMTGLRPRREEPPEMRVILLLKNGEGFYILSEKPALSEDGSLWKGLQAVGGVVVVPAENVLLYESYITDSEIEYAFRARLRELERTPDPIVAAEPVRQQVQVQKQQSHHPF